MSISQRLLLAGKELAKANMGNAFKAITNSNTTPLNSASFRGDTAGIWFFGVDQGNDVHFSFSGTQSCAIAYQYCPPITAIINRKAQAFINGRIGVYNSKGKDASGEYAFKLKKLLVKPNPLQSWKEFEAQAYIYQQLFGYSVILPAKPNGFPNIDATALWNIPPYFLQIKEANKPNFLTGQPMIESVTFKYGLESVALNVEDLIIIKDFTPSLNSLVIPESRIRSLEKPVNNIIGAYESRQVLINKRGPMYMISSNKTDAAGNVSLTTTEKDAIDQEFSRYGLTSRQKTAIVTNAAVTMQPMGFSTRELMLFEEIEDDIMRICDAYAYPYQLMSSAKGTTFANVNDAKKLLYQDGIIPESDSFYEQLNSFFETTRFNIKIGKDFSHVAALQEDEAKKASARLILNQALKTEYEAGLITINQWLEELGRDTIGDIGDIRSTDINNTNVPLATIIGVAGVQSLIGVLTAAGLSMEARANVVQIVFGVSPEDALRMTIENQNTPPDNTNPNAAQQTTN